MSDTTPLGQLAYEGYAAFWCQRGLRTEALVPWDACTLEMQAAWDAAAHVVLAQCMQMAVLLRPDENTPQEATR
jgi:hypothetical protein